tara:strand:+ start:446 stop:832 length:387 start_codon:yes stop_codon:yes gene_type:complete
MKTKKKSLTSTINLGSIPGYAFVSIGLSVKDVLKRETAKEWKEYFTYLDEDGLTTNFCNSVTINDVMYRSVFIEQKNNDNEWYIILAHELIHLCQFICATHQIDMIKEKESVAYLHSHLMRQILDLVK